MACTSAAPAGQHVLAEPLRRDHQRREDGPLVEKPVDLRVMGDRAFRVKYSECRKPCRNVRLVSLPSRSRTAREMCLMSRLMAYPNMSSRNTGMARSVPACQRSRESAQLLDHDARNACAASCMCPACASMRLMKTSSSEAGFGRACSRSIPAAPQRGDRGTGSSSSRSKLTCSRVPKRRFPPRRVALRAPHGRNGVRAHPSRKRRPRSLRSSTRRGLPWATILPCVHEHERWLQYSASSR